jgi:hypothetical protein
MSVKFIHILAAIFLPITLGTPIQARDFKDVKAKIRESIDTQMAGRNCRVVRTDGCVAQHCSSRVV